MYYGFNTGVGRAIEVLRKRKSPLRIGLVGLGAGTLATYGKEGDTFRFYEINENVTELAQKYFTFLKSCPSTVDIIHGDARLILENESPQQFDLLVLDAFSGDAIPTHLLTQEANQSYLRHLRADGLIAIHISNIHFDLRRVTEALADGARGGLTVPGHSPWSQPGTYRKSPENRLRGNPGESKPSARFRREPSGATRAHSPRRPDEYFPDGGPP